MAVPTAVSDTGKKPHTRLMISIKMSPPRSKNTRPPNLPGNPISPRAVIIKCCQWADMRNLIYQLGRRGYRFLCFPSPMSDVKEWPGSQLEGIVCDCWIFFPLPASCSLAFVASSEPAPEVEEKSSLGSTL